MATKGEGRGNGVSRLFVRGCISGVGFRWNDLPPNYLFRSTFPGDFFHQEREGVVHSGHSRLCNRLLFNASLRNGICIFSLEFPVPLVKENKPSRIAGILFSYYFLGYFVLNRDASGLRFDFYYNRRHVILFCAQMSFSCFGVELFASVSCCPNEVGRYAFWG